MSRIFTVIGFVERSALRARVVLVWLAVLACIIPLYDGIVDYTGLPLYVLQDMLINYAGGFVRRGLAGEGVIALSEAFGGAPAFWAWAVLTVFALILWGLSARIYARLPDEPALVIFVLAPWGLLFFVYDFEGSLRKEIFGYIALVLVLNGVFAQTAQRALSWLMAAVVVVVLAVFIHEVNIALGPMMLLGVALMAHEHPDYKRVFLTVAGAAAALCVCIFIWITLQPAPDRQLICDAAQMPVCNGPFWYLDLDAKTALTFAHNQMTVEKSRVYAAQLVLSLVPFLGVRLANPTGMHRRVFWAGVIVHLLVIAPLFYVALDWGRWIQLTAFPASLVLCTAIVIGVVRYRRILPPVLTLIYIASWSISHFWGTVEWNATLMWVFVLASAAIFAVRGRHARALG